MKSIMIDMDEVMVGGGLLHLINEYLGTSYVEADFKDFYMQDVVPNKEEFFKFFLTRNQYDYATLYPNVYEVLEEICKHYKVYIGTSYLYPEIVKESGIIMAYKYEYLLRTFPFLKPENLVFLVDKSVLNCHIKLDDRIDNLKGAETKLLFSSYHNIDINDEELKKDNVIRINNWLELKDFLLK